MSCRRTELCCGYVTNKNNIWWTSHFLIYFFYNIMYMLFHIPNYFPIYLFYTWFYFFLSKWRHKLDGLMCGMCVTSAGGETRCNGAAPLTTHEEDDLKTKTDKNWNDKSLKVAWHALRNASGLNLDLDTINQFQYDRYYAFVSLLTCI